MADFVQCSPRRAAHRRSPPQGSNSSDRGYRRGSRGSLCLKTKQLFRVLPWIETASEDEPGHPLYVHTPQGSGRVDNPEHYTVLYASDDPVGAIGEAFGNMAIWTPGLLEGPPLFSSSRRALITYAAGDTETLDLDDPESLVERQLKPGSSRESVHD